MQASAGEVFIYCCDPGLQAGLCRTSVKFERSSVFCQGLFDLNTNLQIIFIFKYLWICRKVRKQVLFIELDEL